MTQMVATEVNGTEVVEFHEYAIKGSKPSKIIPNAEVEIVIGWGCPRCRTANMEDLDHGEWDKCLKCELVVQLFGNGLHLDVTPHEVGWPTKRHAPLFRRIRTIPLR